MPRIVSNSELTAYNTCKLQHHYMYELGLGPREPSIPLYRGIIGHKALEAYYNMMKDGHNVDDCKHEAMQVLNLETVRLATEEPWNVDKIEQIDMLASRIQMYPEVYRNEPFTVLAVEETFKANMIFDNWMGFIPDLIVEYHRGSLKGQPVVLDHKFIYNFKTLEELKLDAQLPRYMIALQALGYPVKHMVFNQIRTRDLKNAKPVEFFRRSESMVTQTAAETIWEEQKYTLQLIDQKHPPIRALTPMVCKGCWFKDPCTVSMDGESVETMLRIQYKPRDRPLKAIFSE